MLDMVAHMRTCRSTVPRPQPIAGSHLESEVLGLIDG